MADVKGMLNDPEFNKMPMPQQKEALGKLDPEFSNLSDDQYQQFRQKMLAPKRGPNFQRQQVFQNPLAPPTGYKPQDLTWRDYRALGVNNIPTVAGGLGAAFAGGIPGAAGAGMAGEAAKEALVSMVGQENLSGPHIKVEAPPGSLRGASGRIVQSGIEQGGFEAGGELAGMLTRGLLGGAFSAEGRAHENTLIKKASEEYGLKLTAPEIAGKARMAQRVGEYSILSQSFIRSKWGQAAANGVQAIDDILRRIYIPTSPSATGEAVQGMFKLSSDLYRQEAQNMYEQQLKPVAGNILIDMRPVKAAAQRMLDAVVPVKATYKSVGGLGTKAEQMLADIAHSPDGVPFSVVHEMRSNLMKVSPDVDALMADKVQGAAKNLVGETTGAIDTSLSASNPQVKQLWEDARAFYKDGADLFDHQTIQGLMSKNPGEVSRAIKDHDIDTAKRIKGAILEYPRRFGDPSQKQDAEQTWRQFQEQFFRSNLLEDPEHAGLPFDPERLAQVARRMDKIGPGVLKEIYGGDPVGREALVNIRTISDAFGRIQKLPSEGRKYVYDMLAMAGGMTGLLSHSPTGALASAAGFEALPLMISGAIHSKAMTGYLMDGIGGLIKAAKNRPMQALGKAVVDIQERTITSDASYKYLGKAMADLARAGDLYRQAQAAKKSDQPPGAGNQVDTIHLMVNEWAR